MRRLNVREAQIDECIQSSMFALSERPQNPEIHAGELLLLQLVKTDAVRLRRENARINFALIFERFERDWDGSISRRHWPNENRVWDWILYSSATIPTVPFSLESLGLSRPYSGQDNARIIDPSDEERIRPFIQWSLASRPNRDLQIVPAYRIAEEFGDERALAAIYNHDRIAIANPPTMRTVQVEEYVRNRDLAESLRSYYSHSCQVCGHDFKPTYGVHYAEAHHVQYLSEGGYDVSHNMLVLCPNHHRVVHESNAKFDQARLLYRCPNGLEEPLRRADHIIRSPYRQTAQSTLFD
jgi:hypothetical protein